MGDILPAVRYAEMNRSLNLSMDLRYLGERKANATAWVHDVFSNEFLNCIQKMQPSCIHSLVALHLVGAPLDILDHVQCGMRNKLVQMTELLFLQ